MLINLSNHPIEKWTEKQIKSAQKKYGKIIDLQFPNISPYASTYQVKRRAEAYLKKCIKILNHCNDKNNAVHIMGELTFTFSIVNLLKSKKIKCIASTTIRDTKEIGNIKISNFTFIKFREY